MFDVYLLQVKFYDGCGWVTLHGYDTVQGAKDALDRWCAGEFISATPSVIHNNDRLISTDVFYQFLHY